MNRHHPYGGYDAPRRGGMSPTGPGPDRYQNRFADNRGGGFRGRGHGRGGGASGGMRGGYASGGPYDYGSGFEHSGGFHHPDLNDPFYAQENPAYGAPSIGHAPPLASPAGYANPYTHNPVQSQATGVFEDVDARGQARPHRRRERDDKVHDSLIEERIQRERPCRTLFIRNIKYETDSNEVRRKFEEHGEIKTFFDLISNRGMVFVTYYDLRAAERARERLQGTEVSGRPIDVHYSLPRTDDQSKDKNQGTLMVTLRASPSNASIDDNEVRRKFQQFGDVKGVLPSGDRPDQRFVEMYDTRAAEEAHDRLRHQGLQDGVMDIVFPLNPPTGPLPPGPMMTRRAMEDRNLRDSDDGYREKHRSGRGGRGRGRGGGSGGGSGGSGYDDWDRSSNRGDMANDWSRRDRNGSGGHFNDDAFGRGPRGGAGAGAGAGAGTYDEAFSQRNGPGGPSNYTAPFIGVTRTNPVGYNDQSSWSGPTAPDERLEQAKKVSELLAALKPDQPGSQIPAVNATSTVSAPVRPPTFPQSQFYPPTAAQQQYAPPPATTPYPSIHHAPAVPPPNPQQPGTVPSLANIPANLLQLLQAQTQQLQSQPPNAQGSSALSNMQQSYHQQPQYPTGPTQPSSAPIGLPHQSPAAIQQLMALLQQAQSTKSI